MQILFGCNDDDLIRSLCTKFPNKTMFFKKNNKLKLLKTIKKVQ